jgi:hypothetical protein
VRGTVEVAHGRLDRSRPAFQERQRDRVEVDVQHATGAAGRVGQRQRAAGHHGQAVRPDPVALAVGHHAPARAGVLRAGLATAHAGRGVGRLRGRAGRPGREQAQEAQGCRDRAEAAVGQGALQGAADQPLEARVLLRPRQDLDPLAVAHQRREAGQRAQAVDRVGRQAGLGGGQGLGLAGGEAAGPRSGAGAGWEWGLAARGSGQHGWRSYSNFSYSQSVFLLIVIIFWCRERGSFPTAMAGLSRESRGLSGAARDETAGSAQLESSSCLSNGKGTS